MVYLDPKWARQRLRLYGAQDRALEQFFSKLEEEMAELSMKRHNHAKQLVVFFGAATIGTGGGWGADAGLRACRKVVCRPRGPDQLRGKVVLVDEHRTSRVSSAVNGQQPCEGELDHEQPTRPTGWKPPAGQVEQRLVRPAWSQERGQPVRGLMWCPVVPPRKPPQVPRSSQAATQPAASEPGPSTPPPAKRSKPAAEPTKGKVKGKAAKVKPAPQPGRWLDRDCNAALNMQRIGESRWRPLELCYWPDQGALPAKGKEYPGLGYKRLRDKPPKAQEQQQPAEAQPGHCELGAAHSQLHRPPRRMQKSAPILIAVAVFALLTAAADGTMCYVTSPPTATIDITGITKVLGTYPAVSTNVGTQASESTILQLNASLSLYTAGSIVNSQTLQNYKCCTTDNCNSGNPLVISSAVTMAANVVLGLVTCLASFILLSAI
ncbi:hypothetical protein QJQ45_026815 [Haematococcus lacustris]|nr:hypothetical protein QJQ45_026815 [Haematococcus lacustris]